MGHRYLAQVQYLFNRRFDLSVILVRLLRAAALTPRQTERKLRLAEVHRYSGVFMQFQAHFFGQFKS